MRKTLYLTFFIFAFLNSVFAFAGLNVDLEAEHGKKLDKAPFYIRYKFQKTTGIEWKSSAYQQRKAFLENWYIQADREQKSDDQQEKLEREKRSQIQKRKDEKKRLEQEKSRKEQELQQRQKKAQEDLKKKFDDDLKKNDREIDDLRRQSRKSNR